MVLTIGGEVLLSLLRKGQRMGVVTKGEAVRGWILVNVLVNVTVLTPASGRRRRRGSKREAGFHSARKHIFFACCPSSLISSTFNYIFRKPLTNAQLLLEEEGHV